MSDTNQLQLKVIEKKTQEYVGEVVLMKCLGQRPDGSNLKYTIWEKEQRDKKLSSRNFYFTTIFTINR